MREVRPQPSERTSGRGWSLAGIVRWRFLQPALTAAMAAAVVGLLVWSLGTQGSGDTTVVSIGDDQIGGRVVLITDEDVAIMELQGLTDLPDALTFQVWTIFDGTPSSAGLLRSHNGDALAAISYDPDRIDTIAVTIEPAGGSAAPTTDPVLVVDL